MDWVRLWLDMPNDPKWRSIARRSGQRVGDVIAVYTHMLCQARASDNAGHIEAWDDEDVSAALDLDASDVKAIREAMQGKVLDGDKLTGWEKRQPKREDDSTERVRAYRERRKAQTERAETPKKRDVTQRNAPDTETDSETVSNETGPPPERQADGFPRAKNLPQADGKNRAYPEAFERFWRAWPQNPNDTKTAAYEAWRKAANRKDVELSDLQAGAEKQAAHVADWPKDKRVHVQTWINREGWTAPYDELSERSSKPFAGYVPLGVGG